MNWKAMREFPSLKLSWCRVCKIQNIRKISHPLHVFILQNVNNETFPVQSLFFTVWTFLSTSVPIHLLVVLFVVLVVLFLSGVGGIEAEAVMLGQAISMVLPQVVGYKITGTVHPLVTSTDVVLTITKVWKPRMAHEVTLVLWSCWAHYWCYNFCKQMKWLISESILDLFPVGNTS